MRRLKFLVPLTVWLLVSAAIADQEPYCTYPDVDPEQRSYHVVNLWDPGLGIGNLLPQVDHDINLSVEQDLWDNYHAPGGIVDNYHLEQFIRGIWRNHQDNDIRTVWNYFAAHGPRLPDLPEYGQFGTTAYNFKYPELPDITHDNQTEVNIRLDVGITGSGQCSGNTITIDLAAQHLSVANVPDWWYNGEWAGRTFVHEFQHTIGACFEPGYLQDETWEYFQEGFCEAAVAVAGYSKIMVGVPHGEGPWFWYDLIYNNGIEESLTNLNYANQSECSGYSRNKYTGGFLWSAYIADQFPGADPNVITDDLLYQALRIADGGEMEEGMRAFALAAANYSAWGYQNDPALFHEIFRRWTLANLLDGTSVDPTLTYPNHTVRIRYDSDAGVGWLRDNEDDYCNDHPWPVDPDPDALGCGRWFPETLSLQILGQPQTYSTSDLSDCTWDPVVGIELYAADYVAIVPANPFPQGTILSVAFDVYDEDQNWDSNNVLMQCDVVAYGVDENEPIDVASVDMSQSDYPLYEAEIFHHVPNFGCGTSLVHTVMRAMENEPLTSGRYPMRTYTITARAVPQVIYQSGTITETTIWFSGQTVLIPQGAGLTVASGADLIIQPGVTVVLGGGSSIGISGGLVARGNGSLPVTFTASTHTPGEWSGIYTSGPSSVLDLEHCLIEYADKGVLVSYSGSHVIEDNTFHECNHGVYLDGVTLSEFRGNTFDQNAVGMYMNQSWISDSDGFRDLTFTDNDVGLKVETPSGGTSALKSSNFSGNADCAIYYNRNTGAGDLELQDLLIEDQVPAQNAGIRVLGRNSEPVIHHCHVHNFAGGPIGPNKGISCTGGGRVAAGTKASYGANRFEGNECDIEYTNRAANPPNLDAVGNCWGTDGDDPVFCGNQIPKIIWNPWDCEGWRGPKAPPRPEAETVAGLVGVFPNPAEGSFRIAYGLGASEWLKVQIYDLSGRLVRTVVEIETPAGTHEVEWDGTDAQGRTVGKGVYVCRIVGESFVESKRLVVTR